MNYEELYGIANEYSTPTYVFDIERFKLRISKVRSIWGKSVELCYAMKANPFLIEAAQEMGIKLEVCSPGELAICKRAKINSNQIVYSGVNKQPADIAEAVEYGAGMLTAESRLQVRLLEREAAQAGVILDVLVRYAAGSQFGMSKEDLFELVDTRNNYPHLRFLGIHYFVGTQRKNLKHQKRELEMLARFFEELRKEHDFMVERLEYGPGLAVPLFEDDDFSDDLAPAYELAACLEELSKSVRLTVETGRFFATSCGTYLTRIADLKQNDGINYCILDGGINHLTYSGQLMGLKVPIIENLTAKHEARSRLDTQQWTLCGSLCTVNDVLVREVELGSLELDDVLAFRNAGAYTNTEGVFLFLSRTMPRVVLRYDSERVLARDYIETSVLNENRR